MREPILMPTLSDTMETGHLIDWLKQPGDAVKKGEAIAEVETDKAVMDVEAFHDGYLAGPLAAADTDVPVGAVIGYIVDSIDSVKDETQAEKARPVEAPATTPPQKEVKKPPVAAERPGKGAAKKVPASRVGTSSTNLDEFVQDQAMPSHRAMPVSPYARGLARDLGIDLARVAPGPGGCIRAAQVVATVLGRPEPNLDDGPGYELQPLDPMQRAIVNNMNAAAVTPIFHVSARLSLDPLRALAHQEKYSLTLLLARACALSVEAHPRFNMVYTSNGWAVREQIDVGIAVDVPNGLVTPVLRDVARRPIEKLADDWKNLKKRVTEKKRSQRLTPRDYRGATFYLSNLGMFAVVSHFDAVVPMGAAAILAVGAARDGLAEFTLSCDHRVVYGADAARFMETLAVLLGEPKGLKRAKAGDTV